MKEGSMNLKEVPLAYLVQELESRAIRGPDTATEIAMKKIGRKRQEHVLGIFLDNAHRPIKSKVITIGTATASMVSPRDILIEALRCNATSLIVAHNHPSGDTKPSSEDIGVTERLQVACQAIGINLLDHIIVSRTGSYSFNAEGRL
jgi:DNA repair protein RadC